MNAGALEGRRRSEGRPASPTASLVFLVQRIGPYHHARLNALAVTGAFQVTAIEFRIEDPVYAWQPVEALGAYQRRAAPGRERLKAALQDLQPTVIVCVGYADPEIQAAAAWALARGLPLVTCCDSTRDDEPRSFLKEAFKRHLLRAFDTALVAGQRSRAYLAGLGIPEARCFGPWDVVDNAHFEEQADQARRGPPGVGRPEHYFLCVARFVDKKNLSALVDGFAAYARQSRLRQWDLVLSGSGPLEPALRAQVAALGLGGRVHFPGFLQYDALPAWYAQAKALILPSRSDQWGLVVNEAMASGLPVLVSSRCGCAPDLVKEGKNGFLLDPADVPALGTLLGRIAQLPSEERERMGQRSRELIAAYSPEAFARGLVAAARAAQANRRTWTSPLLLAQLHLLSRRGRALP